MSTFLELLELKSLRKIRCTPTVACVQEETSVAWAR